MKVLAIRGSDIASLSGSFEVDFEQEPLAGTGLFAITGPTGSGKSTLLDVLCLALFGETPRISSAGITEVQVTLGHVGEGHVLTARDPRNLLRRGAAQGRAEAVFQGVDGGRYRATWSVRRANLQPDGRMQAAKSSLVRVADDVILSQGTPSQVKRDVEAVLGLSFEQFGKAVLLAQGDFAAFLKAKAKERSDLLEKITGGEIYAEVSRRAFDRKKTVEEELKARQGEVDRLRPMGEDERRTLEEGLKAIRASVKALVVRKGQAEAAGRAIAESQGLVEEAEKAVRGAQAAAEAAGKAASRVEVAAEEEKRAGETARAANEAREAQRPEIEAARRLDDSVDRKTGEAKVARDEAAAARRKAGEERAAAARLEADLAKVEADLKAATDWLTANDGAKSLSASWDAIDGAFTRLESASSELLETGKKAEENRKAREKLDGEDRADNELIARLDGETGEASSTLERAREAAAAVDRNALVEERKAISAENGILTELKGISGKAGAARRRAEEAEEKGRACAEKAGEETEKKETAEARVRELDLALSVAKRERDAARDVRNLAEYRPQLVPGQPCPLCGSTEHPWGSGAAPDDAADALDRSVERIDADLQVARKKASEHGVLIETTSKERTRWEAEARRAREELKEARLAWDETGRSSSRGGPLRTVLAAGPDAEGAPAALAELAAETKRELSALAPRESEAGRLEKARDEAQRLFDGLAGKLREARARVEKRAESLGKKREEGAGLRSRFEAAETRRKETLEELRRFAEPGPDEVQLEKSPTTVRGAWFERVRLYRAREKQRDGATEKKGDLSTKVALAMASAEAAERAAQEKVEKEAALAGEASRLTGDRALLLGGKAVGEVTKALEAAVSRTEAALASARKTHHEAVVKRTAAVTEAEGAKKGAAVAAEKAEVARKVRTLALSRLGLAEAEDPAAAVEKALREIDLAHDEEVERQRGADAAILSDDRTREELKRAVEALRSTEESGRVWIALSKLIGTQDGAAFRTFAQGITLRTLLQGANVHLNELAPRYQLRPVRGTDMDLLVVDRDMGDEARSVESLSGGESFLVSLALALGLASLASKRTTIRSLFIDEGFGSLDNDTLDKALSVLDGLQSMGRRVGIISHVSALKDRIGVRVQVSPLGNGRSRVRVVAG